MMATCIIVFSQLVILGVWLRTARHASALQVLPCAKSLAIEPIKKWPRLSILIPALNEGTTLRAALMTLLAVDYPDFEIICVNDRSTDDTGSVIQELAAQDNRIKAINVSELPNGWLGKVHALDQALIASTGDFILCTDADVHFSKDALKRSVMTMEHRRLDHLSLLPKIASAGFLFDTALAQAGWVLFYFINPAKMGTDECRAPMGVGAFNLVRADLMRRIQPFKTLRMEVIDDIGLAIVCHQAQGKGALMGAGTAVSLEYYAGYGEMLKGLEKNAFALSRYSLVRASAENMFVIAAPLLAFVCPFFRSDWTISSGVAVYLISCLLEFRSLQNHGVNPALIPAFPLGMMLCGIAGVRSMVQTLRRGGINWRGTTYPLSDLRRMQITKLPIPKRNVK